MEATISFPPQYLPNLLHVQEPELPGLILVAHLGPGPL